MTDKLQMAREALNGLQWAYNEDPDMGWLLDLVLQKAVWPNGNPMFAVLDDEQEELPDCRLYDNDMMMHEDCPLLRSGWRKTLSSWCWMRSATNSPN